MRVAEVFEIFEGIDQAELLAFKNQLEGRAVATTTISKRAGVTDIRVRRAAGLHGNLHGGNVNAAGMSIPAGLKDFLLKLLAEYLTKRKKVPEEGTEGGE